MTTPSLVASSQARVDTARRYDPAAPLSISVASAALGLALLLGVAGDALLRDGPTGIGFPIWVGLVAITIVSLAWCGRDRAVDGGRHDQPRRAGAVRPAPARQHRRARPRRADRSDGNHSSRHSTVGVAGDQVPGD